MTAVCEAAENPRREWGEVMNAVRSILVIVDPAAAQHSAIVKGALLAEKFGAKLELFACNAELHPLKQVANGSAQSTVSLATELKGLLETLAVPLRARSLEVTTDAICAAPLHAALLDHVQHTNADLVVKDTRHHTFARRTVFTNTDWELIRGLSAPLLLTKPKVWPRSASVLAAVDPGHEHDRGALDHCILDHAARLAQGLEGRLHVVHAFACKVPVIAPIMPGPLLAASISPEALAAEHAAKIKILTGLADKYSLPLANIHLEVGGVRGSICNVAAQVHADIIVMGAMSRTGLARAFIGNTAEEVLERLPCDALIVKS
jgi:universal stress protein E